MEGISYEEKLMHLNLWSLEKEQTGLDREVFKMSEGS